MQLCLTAREHYATLADFLTLQHIKIERKFSMFFSERKVFLLNVLSLWQCPGPNAGKTVTHMKENP